MEQFKGNYILEDDPDGYLKDEDTTETTPPAHQQQAIKAQIKCCDGDDHAM